MCLGHILLPKSQKHGGYPILQGKVKFTQFPTGLSPVLSSRVGIAINLAKWGTLHVFEFSEAECAPDTLSSHYTSSYVEHFS